MVAPSPFIRSVPATDRAGNAAGRAGTAAGRAGSGLDHPGHRASQTWVAGPSTPDLTSILASAGCRVVSGPERLPAESQTMVIVIVERDSLPDAAELRHRFGLSSREAEVALMLAERASNKELATSLGVTLRTAERHTCNVMRKLQVFSRKDVRSRLMSRDGSRFRHVA